MYTVAMAYCGSGNNKAIRRLLHVAVSTLTFLGDRGGRESLQANAKCLGDRSIHTAWPLPVVSGSDSHSLDTIAIPSTRFT